MLNPWLIGNDQLKEVNYARERLPLQGLRRLITATAGPFLSADLNPPVRIVRESFGFLRTAGITPVADGRIAERLPRSEPETSAARDNRSSQTACHCRGLRGGWPVSYPGSQWKNSTAAVRARVGQFLAGEWRTGYSYKVNVESTKFVSRATPNLTQFELINAFPSIEVSGELHQSNSFGITQRKGPSEIQQRER